MIILNKGNYTGFPKEKLYQDGVLINIIHYSMDYTPVGVHYHENPHLCLILQGGDKENRKGNSYLRASGDLFFYYAGESHNTVFQKNLTKSLVIEFEENFLRKYDISESQMEFSIKNNPHIKFQLLKLLHESSKKNTSNSLSIEMLLLGMFTSSANSITTRIPNWVKIVDEVLLTKWNEPVSLKELSLASQVHPVTISKYFSKYYHRTIGDHITHIRIEKSIPLIKDTKISLGEIGHYCGFADQSHFIRNFKNSTGFLPGELRKI